MHCLSLGRGTTLGPATFETLAATKGSRALQTHWGTSVTSLQSVETLTRKSHLQAILSRCEYVVCEPATGPQHKCSLVYPSGLLWADLGQGDRTVPESASI
jgi:hypothetical protein